MEHDAMLVVSSLERAEQALAAGQLRCPGCGGVLRPFGYARRRTVRGMGTERLTLTPRRSRCADCWASHVLLPTALSVRRADSTEAIGTALLAHADGVMALPLMVIHPDLALSDGLALNLWSQLTVTDRATPRHRTPGA